MFYDLFLKKKRYKASTPGRWNLERVTDFYMKSLERAGALSGRVLELGPGDGGLAHRLAAAGLEYRAIDRSPGLVEKLTSEGLTIVEGAVPPIPFEDGEFDLVCCMALLEHMPTYDHGIELIAEARRVLRPGGALIVVVPDLIRGGIDFLNWDYTHAFAQTPSRLLQVLSDGDFEVGKVVGLTGSLSNRVLRFPVDVAGFVVHSRFVYWLAAGLGLEVLTNGFHKTFQPALLTIARKPG